MFPFIVFSDLRKSISACISHVNVNVSCLSEHSAAADAVNQEDGEYESGNEKFEGKTK